MKLSINQRKAMAEALRPMLVDYYRHSGCLSQAHGDEVINSIISYLHGLGVKV